MKNFIINAVLVLFSTSAFAGSCPMMAKSLDEKIEQAQQLRDDAMTAHDKVIMQNLKNYSTKL